PLARERAREAADRLLARCVHRVAGHPLGARVRGEIDHRAVPAALEMRVGRAHRPEHGRHAHVHRALIELVGGLADRRVGLRPGRAVHEHVEAAELLHGGLDGALAVGAQPHVGDDARAAAPERAHGRRAALGLRGIDLRDRHVGALARERERDRAADPLARTRHERDPAREALRHTVSTRSIETGIALMRGMPVYGSNSRSPSTRRPVVLPISRYSRSRSGASPNACDIESTPRRSSGAASATPRMLAWSEAIRTVSPGATPSAARSSGCRNAGLYGRPRVSASMSRPDELYTLGMRRDTSRNGRPCTSAARAPSP